MANETKSNSRLTVCIENDELVVRIGVGTLAWAFEHLDTNNPFDDELNDYRQTYRVEDTAEFAPDVRCEMLREKEDGSHPLSDFLDKMCWEAVNQGCIGVEECTDNKSAWVRDAEISKAEGR